MTGTLPSPIERPSGRLHVGLRLKLTAGLLLILIPLLGLLLAEFNEATARRRAFTLDTLAQTAEAVALATDATFDEAIAVGWAIANETAVQSLDPAQVRPQLQRLARIYRQYASLSVFDLRGQLVAETAIESPVPGATESIADRAYFQRVLTYGAPTPIEVIVGRRTGRPATGVSVPIFGTDGAPRGVVVISFDLNRFGERLEAVGLRPGQDISLIDHTGRLAHAARGMDAAIPWEQRDLSDVPQVQRAIAGETVRIPDLRPTGNLAGGVGVFAGDTAGARSFAAAFVPSRKYRWIVAVTWPAEIALGPVESSHRQQLVGFGALAAVALAGTIWLSHLMTDPIRRVIEQATAIGEGHLDRRVDIRTLDELQHLGTAFNAMAERLESTRDDLLLERAKAESERAAAQRAHHDLQQFLGFVAHDLRTPIAGVKASVGVILAHEPADFPRPLSRMLRGVDTAADRMTKLVADLLDAARIGEGRFVVRPRPADLAAIVRRVADQQRVLTPQRRLMVDTPGTLPGRWDPERLEQVFANLIGNAVKFSPATAPVRIVLDADPTHATVTVTDHGTGISPEDLPRLFRPFSRLVPGDTVRGTGLGLYISQAIVHAHGGAIAIESEGPGTGTRVTVRLPILTAVGGGDA